MRWEGCEVEDETYHMIHVHARDAVNGNMFTKCWSRV